MDYIKDTSLCAAVKQAFAAPDKDPAQMSPLVLAYVGDTVFDLYVRTLLVLQSDLAVQGLNARAAARVCAHAQAEGYFRIADKLTDAELGVFKRGRNAHMGTVPKHASIADYRAATGLEALLGYLYLRGEDARLGELMGVILSPVPDGKEG